MTSIEPRPIVGVHHAAFRCRDAEQTIWFYRDVLGLADPTGSPRSDQETVQLTVTLTMPGWPVVTGSVFTTTPFSMACAWWVCVFTLTIRLLEEML